MTSKHAFIVAAALILVALAWWQWPRAAPTVSSTAASDESQAPVTTGDDFTSAALSWADGGRPSPGEIASARRHADAVRSLLATRPSTGSTPTNVRVPTMPAPVGSGNQINEPLGKYVDDVIKREFMPMAKGCYADLLRKQPDAGGAVLFDVTILGDTSVGGVVDSVRVDAASTLSAPDFVTCVRESMMAMTFHAPPNGSVTFTLPLDFAP